MKLQSVLVVGGSGFVGRHLAAALARHAVRIIVPTRSAERAKHLTTLPTVEVVSTDVFAPGELERLAAGCQMVVNLAGILHGRRGRPDERGPNDYGPNWPAQRNAARARDGFRCRQCGKAEDAALGRQHDVHHLTPFRSFGYVPGLNENYKLANDLDNLQTLCRACHQRAEAARGTQTALGGLAYALGNIAPLFLMCDPRDLGVSAEARSRETKAPTITIYDLVPEGLGFAERLYELHGDLLRGARDLVRDCPCRDGCPACVGPVGVDGLETKALTRRLAESLSGGK
jgi:NAD(P)-dependent dehydrogenase (short-subunit alcohol dehydrogenase family)